MRYNYNYKNDKFKILKLIILAVAFFADLLNIVLLISTFFDKNIWITIVFIFFICFIIRFSTIYLTYEIEYSYYNGILEVTKCYYRRKYICFKISKKDIVSIEKNVDKNAKKVYSKTCYFEKYIVKLNNNEIYELNLDDTLYAALICEEKYDIFRQCSNN